MYIIKLTSFLFHNKFLHQDKTLVFTYLNYIHPGIVVVGMHCLIYTHKLTIYTLINDHDYMYHTIFLN